ncbi:methyltransferase [Kribbella ginsengisoli]|uniref:methyltransferase n=1 Tax=Kribbella ginsengisoli TaxID=363865 RepID=UPI0031D05624
MFELAEVLPEASKTFEAEGLSDRVELVAGDFFVEVPPGDAYLIKSCVHNFGDERAIELFGVLRRAGAPLLLVDTMIPAGNEPHYSKFDDVEMMVIAGRNDRTEAEWAALVTAAGFEPGRVVRCDERFSLLEAF